MDAKHTHSGMVLLLAGLGVFFVLSCAAPPMPTRPEVSPPAIQSIEGNDTSFVGMPDTMLFLISDTSGRPVTVSLSCDSMSLCSLLTSSISEDSFRVYFCPVDSGSYRFSVTASNRWDSVTYEHRLTAIPEPVLIPRWNSDVMSASMNEGEQLSITLRDSVDYDGDDSLRFSLLPGSPVDDSIVDSSSQYCFAASFSDSGHYEVGITVADSLHCDTMRLGLRVLNVNRVPTFSSMSSEYMIQEDSSLVVALRGSDADGDSVWFFVDSTDVPRKDSIGIDGAQLRWSSVNGDGGVYDLTLGITDGVDTATETVRINVRRGPVLAWRCDSITVHVEEGATLYLQLGDSILYAGSATVAFDLMPGGPVSDTIPVSGLYRFSPTYDDSGTYDVQVRASDGDLADTLIMRLIVQNINRPPAFTRSCPRTTYSIEENAALAMCLQASDPDSDVAVVFIDSCGLPRCVAGPVTDSIYSWDSEYGDEGLYTVVVGVTDGVDTTRGIVEIGVGAVNVPPTIQVDDIAAGSVISVTEGSTLTFTAYALDDNPLDSVGFSSEVTNAPWSDGNGTGSFNPQTGVFTYTPGFSVSSRQQTKGYDSISIEAFDNGVPPQTTSFVFHVTVIDSNRAPSVSLLSPENGVRTSRHNLVLTWSGADPDSDSLTYELFRGTVSGQLEPLISTSDTFYSFGTPPAEGATIYWRVDAGDGRTVTRSVVRTLKLNFVPTVALNGSADLTVDQPIPVRLSWSGGDNDPSDAGTLLYSVYLAKGSGEYREIVEDTAAGSCVVYDADYSSSYRWKVSVTDGKDTAYSPERTFSTWAPRTRLRDMSVTYGTLVPEFDPNTEHYRVTLHSDQDTLAITVVPDDTMASATIDGKQALPGAAHTIRGIPFGTTSIPVRVTAGDGATRKTYTVETVRLGRTWQRVFGSSEYDWGNDVEQCADSGFIVVGNRASDDIYAVRLDKNGDTLWTETIDNTAYDDCFSVCRGSNGGFVLAGTQGYYGRIVFLSAAGAVVGQANVLPVVQAKGIVPLPDGYLVAGYANTSTGGKDIVVAELSSDGSLVRADTLGAPGDQRTTGVALYPDNSFLVASYSRIVRVGWDFSLGWEYLPADGEMFWDAEPTDDGGCVITGHIGSRLLVHRLDNLGDSVWTAEYEGSGDSQARGIITTSDGGFAVVGMTDTGMFLGRIGSNGDWHDMTFYGERYDQYGTSIHRTFDGGFVLLGSTRAYGAGGYDMYVVKTDLDGNSGDAPP